MKIITSMLVGAGLLAAAFGAGYYSHKPEVQIVTQQHVQQAEQLVKQVVTKRSTKPNGATTETITETVAAATKTETTHTKAVVPASPSSSRNNWSLGVKWRPELSVDWSVPIGMEVSRRVLGDFWVTGEYQWDRSTLLLGIRYEF